MARHLILGGFMATGKSTVGRIAAERTGAAFVDTDERIGPLLEARAAAYAECHARLPTDARSPEEVADAATAVWRREPIAVAAGARSYVVDVGDALLGERAAALASSAPVRLLVTDRNVAALHAAPVERALSGAHTLARVVLEPGEEHKNIGAVERIWDAALAASADRGMVVVALGGGVVSDIAGLAAATFMRGVAWFGLPTTLLAMVDASVGGKTAVDRGAAKNAVGAFWQPSGVVCDVSVLATEPERGFRSALAEVVKTALVGDASLLDVLEREAARIQARDPALVVELVRRSVAVKAGIVSRDEREQSGLRAQLNLGHTFGHALEAHGGYRRLPHGEAVSLGLVAALRLGERLGVTHRAVVERTVRLLDALGLTTDLSAEPLAEAARLVAHDKKRAGTDVRFVLVQEPGRLVLQRVPLAELVSQAPRLRSPM